MTDNGYLLAIDQGTTSTRAIVFDGHGQPGASAQLELPQIFPRDGWVEHDAEVIWQHTVEVCRATLKQQGIEARQVAAIGITNQRETAVIWDRGTGAPIHNAIVWQDRRTAPQCREIVSGGHEALVRDRTGLVVDPYFSGTKITWLLDNVDGARARAESGELAFGTIDCFLLWRLTGGKVHTTDATNACRTMAFNIHTQAWDNELLALLRIPRSLLPEVTDCAHEFGTTEPELFGAAIPVRGMAGDQHAATVGQACFAPGMVKSTYGTGAFMVLNTGDHAFASKNRLLTTLAYRLNGEPTYALEGSIFVAGAAVQWLRDMAKMVATAPETEDHARAIDDTGGVYLVPAFTGLGAPYWDPDARGALIGLTRDSGVPEIVRATLEAVAYETRDLVEAMAADMGAAPNALRVDGGMVANSWLMQFVADILAVTVERPTVPETTALGAAYLAGLQSGVFEDLDQISRFWQLETAFEPQLADARRNALYAGWLDAVARVRSH